MEYYRVVLNEQVLDDKVSVFSTHYQFLLEAVTLSLIGGVIGIGLGVVGAEAISALAEDFRAVVSPQAVLLATTFSAAVGLFFGIYPARRASLLNPIDALRYE